MPQRASRDSLAIRQRSRLSAPNAIVTDKGKIPETNNIDQEDLEKNSAQNSKQSGFLAILKIKTKSFVENKSHLIAIILLAFCTFLLVLSCILFTTLSKSSDPYQYVVTSYATIWPLENKFSMRSMGESTLTVFWGDTNPTLISTPSFCGTPKIFCYVWPSNDLKVQLITYQLLSPNIDCIVFEWTKSSKIKATEFSSKISTNFESTFWYGGLISSDIGWPMKSNTKENFVPLFTSKVYNSGIQEPMWISNTGFGIFSDRLYPIEINQTKSIISIRSDDPYGRALKYAICRALNSQTLVTQSQEIRQLIFDDEPASPITQRRNITIQNAPKPMFIVVDLDLDDINNINTTDVTDLLKKFNNSSFIVNFRNFDFFDNNLTTQLINLLNNTDLIRTFDTAVETNNFIRSDYMNQDLAKWLKMCILQSTGPHNAEYPNPLGAILWNEKLYFVVDFTTEETQELFLETVESHPVQNLIKYLSFTDGTAAQLPVLPLLNISAYNLNLYSFDFVQSISELGNLLSVSTGYGNQNSKSNFLNFDVAIHPDNVTTIIPLCLTLNLFGYSNLILHYSNDLKSYGNSSIEMNNLIRWLELAMFMPKYRIPFEIVKTNFFASLYNRYENVRKNTILPNYLAADEKWRENQIPVIRPMWWSESNDNYTSDVWLIDNQFMIGDNLIVAAFLLSKSLPSVYLPQGIWQESSRPGLCYKGGDWTVLAEPIDITCLERVKNATLCSL